MLRGNPLANGRTDRNADLACGLVGSVVHLAYHVGAIRQIHAAARGPKDGDEAP